MLYKKSKFGTKYVRLISGSPTIFLCFVITGVSLFLFLTLTTRLEMISTYSAEESIIKNEVILLVKTNKALKSNKVTRSDKKTKAVDVTEGIAYIYTDKNKVVYPILIKRFEKVNEKYILHCTHDGQENIKALSSHFLFIDLPQEEETLLHRIFVKGGKGNK